ncbi:MAG TPA: glycosyltransferase 87 family protein [Thermoleophilaceae bacterium]|jgi:alpha-1,6-mannosyltransferase
MDAAAVPLRSAHPARQVAAFAALGGLAACSAAIVAGAEAGLDQLVPAAKEAYPGWLRGPLSALGIDMGPAALGWLLVAMSACYLLALASADSIPVRAGIGAVVGLHALFLVAPPLLSSDVFGYIDAARLGALHGVSPYAPGDTPLPPDAVHLYRRWGTDLPSPYGPLFVLLSYALVPLGIAGGLWVFKALTAAGSLATVWLVWRCAVLLGRDPLKAALFVGLNPIVLLFAVGGAHNDFFALPLIAGAVYLALLGRERLTGAALVAAAAIKLPLGLPLAFAAARAGARRRDLAKGALIAVAVVTVVSLIVFGSEAVSFVREIRQQQDRTALYSVPNQVGEALGLGGITDGIRLAAGAVLAAALALALRAAWRGADWIAAAGWATFALLVTSAWLLPWYLAWLFPLAAIAGDRRLRLASLALAAYVIVTRVELWTSLPG